MFYIYAGAGAGAGAALFFVGFSGVRGCFYRAVGMLGRWSFPDVAMLSCIIKWVRNKEVFFLFFGFIDYYGWLLAGGYWKPFFFIIFCLGLEWPVGLATEVSTFVLFFLYWDILTTLPYLTCP